LYNEEIKWLLQLDQVNTGLWVIIYFYNKQLR